MSSGTHFYHNYNLFIISYQGKRKERVQNYAIASNRNQRSPFHYDEDARSVHPVVTQINAIVDNNQLGKLIFQQNGF